MKTHTTKKKGQPPKSAAEKAEENLRVRVRADRKTHWQDYCEARGTTLSKLITMLLDAATCFENKIAVPKKEECRFCFSTTSQCDDIGGDCESCPNLKKSGEPRKHPVI